MPPKRQRGEASSSRPPRRELTPHEVNKYNLTFRDNKQAESYDRLISRGIQTTRFIDSDVLERFELKEDLHWLFEKLGWNSLWRAKWNTFEKYTLEFLSSLKVNVLKLDSRDDLGSIEFRLNGVEHSLTLEEFNEIYGFPVNGIRGVTREFHPSNFWRSISSEHKHEASKAKASTIMNPIFRYMQRVMANTIFARDDSQGVARLDEIFVMWAALNDVHIDTGYFLAHQFIQVANRTRGPIVIGGMIAPILSRYRVPVDDLQPVVGPTSLDLFFCVRTHMFEERGSTWVIKQSPHFTLPNRERTTIHRRENWLLQPLHGSSSHPSTSAPSTSAGPSSSDALFYIEYPGFEAPPPSGSTSDASIHTRLDDLTQLLSSMATSQRENQDVINQRLSNMETMMQALYNQFIPQPPPPDEPTDD